MQRSIALRQLTGDYGTVAAGDYFEVGGDAARLLLVRGLAQPADPPRIVLEMVGQRIIYQDPA